MSNRKNALAYNKIIVTVLTVILIAITFLLSSCARENSHLYTIGLVTNNRNGLRNIQGFQDKMTELDYIVGRNVKYMFEGFPVRGSNLDAVLNKFIKAKVDLIFTAGTPTGVAAHRITSGTNIPVIFGVIADPIAAGVMNDLIRPGGNITGVKLCDNQARRLQFLVELAPDIKRILTIMGTSLTITNDTTGSTIADYAIAWLTAAVGYSEKNTTARDKRRGSLLQWEVWRQNAYEVMASIDKTKFRYHEGTGMWMPKTYKDVWINAYVRDNAEDEETYGA